MSYGVAFVVFTLATPAGLPPGPFARIPGGQVLDALRVRVPRNAAPQFARLCAENRVPVVRTNEEGRRAPATEAETLLALPELSEEARRHLPRLAYQLEGAVWFCRKVNAHAWWHAGSGKTLAALAYALREPGLVVFVTRAGARWHIEGQVSRWTTVKAQVLEGEAAAGIDEDTRIAIVGWEGLPHHVAALKARKPVTVVWDELHRGKSWKRWRAVPGARGPRFEKLDNIASAAMDLSRRAGRRLGTTATSVKDRVRDFWAQGDLVEPGAWGNFFRHFAPAFCGAHDGLFGFDTKGATGLLELRERLVECVHFVPREVSHRDLPPCRLDPIHLPVSAQNAPSGGWAEELREAHNNPERLFEIHLMLAASRKRSYVLGQVREAVEAGQKVVVFSGRRRDTERLGVEIRRVLWKAEAFAGGEIGPLPPKEAKIPVWVVHGGTPGKVRQQAADDYMAVRQAPAVFVATGFSAGESCDLQSTDLQLLPMLPWTTGDLVQWFGRVCRLGQDRPVIVRPIIAVRSWADEAVAATLLSKLGPVLTLTGDNHFAEVADALEGIKGREKEIFAGMAEKLAREESLEA